MTSRPGLSSAIYETFIFFEGLRLCEKFFVVVTGASPRVKKPAGKLWRVCEITL